LAHLVFLCSGVLLAFFLHLVSAGHHIGTVAGVELLARPPRSSDLMSAGSAPDDFVDWATGPWRWLWTRLFTCLYYFHAWRPPSWWMVLTSCYGLVFPQNCCVAGLLVTLSGLLNSKPRPMWPHACLSILG